jgi:GAF domain-containing protein
MQAKRALQAQAIATRRAAQPAPDAWDAWGEALRAALAGHVAAVTLERDDGLVHELALDDYLATGFRPVEQPLERLVFGRVLDAGCGAGRHALTLQPRGHPLTALDASPGAVDVARAGGVADVRHMDITAPSLPTCAFDTQLLLGSGVGSDLSSFEGLLGKLFELAAPGGRLLVTQRDVLQTSDEAHLRYHDWNRQRGRYVGHITLRFWHAGRAGPWFDILHVRPDDLSGLAQRAGWHVTGLWPAGDLYAAALEKRHPQPGLHGLLVRIEAEIRQPSRPSRATLEECVDVLHAAHAHFDWTGIYLAQGQDLVLGPFRGPPTEHVRIPIGSGICGAAAQTGQTIVVPDVRQDERFLACFPSTRSEVVVPITWHSVVLGEIDVDSDTPDAFGQEDVWTLQAVAARLGQMLGSQPAAG